MQHGVYISFYGAKISTQTTSRPLFYYEISVFAMSLLAIHCRSERSEESSPCHYPPSRRCEVTSCYPHEAISVSLPLIPSLRGHFLLSSRSNLRVTTPHPVVARSLLAILTKQSPCHYPPSSRCDVSYYYPQEAIPL